MVFLPLLLEPLATESLLRTLMAVIIEAIFSSPYVLIPTASSTSCTCHVALATTGEKEKYKKPISTFSILEWKNLIQSFIKFISNFRTVALFLIRKLLIIMSYLLRRIKVPEGLRWSHQKLSYTSCWILPWKNSLRFIMSSVINSLCLFKKCWPLRAWLK